MEEKTTETTSKTADSITVTEAVQDQKKESKITPEDEKIINSFKNLNLTSEDLVTLVNNLSHFNHELKSLKDVSFFITEENIGILKKLNEKDNIKINLLLSKLYINLISNESLYSNPLETLDEMSHNASSEDVVEIKLDELRANPYQPRRTFDNEKLQELANSIREFGVLEPIIVKKSIKGYEIVAGERRFKASKIAGLETIPAIIKDFTDEDMMQIALLENIQREDLSAIEEAEAYQNLVKTLGISQEELAKRIGKSRSHVTNMIGLLKLPEEVKKNILNGEISMGHARVLSKLEDKDTIMELANKIVKDTMSVRDLEQLVSDPNYKRTKPIKVRVPNPFGYVEEAFTDKVGNKVRIQNKKIVIPFNSEKDLERILEILNVDVKVD